MGMNQGKLFFQNIRSALGHDPVRRRPWADMGRCRRGDTTIVKRDREDRLALLETLQERSKVNSIPVSVCSNPAMAASVVAGIVKQNLPEEGGSAHVMAWRHAVIDSLELELALATVASQITVCAAANGEQGPRESDRQRAKDLAATAVCGITSADWCLAETATLVMRTRPGQGRAVSLLPPVHIAVIPLSSLIGGLAELYSVLGNDRDTSYHGLTNCMTFVSGRSTTRDIESVAVPGAHGPKAMHIVVITG